MAEKRAAREKEINKESSLSTQVMCDKRLHKTREQNTNKYMTNDKYGIVTTQNIKTHVKTVLHMLKKLKERLNC